MQVEPFSVKPTSVFNRIATDGVLNDFIHGVLTLVILVELRNICQAIMYAKPTLQSTAMYRFITFHRASTLSFFHQTLASFLFRKMHVRRETPARYFKASRTKHTVVFLTACFTAAGLILIELAVIIAGTSVLTPVTAGSARFDPKLGGSTRAPRTIEVRPGCDDFFIQTRGVQKAGAVLKCVSAEVGEMFDPSDTQSFLLKTDINDNTHIFSITPRSRMNITSARLSISISTIGQGEIEVAPFRWDGRVDDVLQLFQIVAEGTLNRSLPSFQDTIFSYSVDVGSKTYEYREESFAKPYEQLTKALVSQLRMMDVVLNSTSPPWAFVRGNTYERRPDIVVSIMVSNRFPQGAVAIVAVALVLLRVLINSYFTSYDDVAYVVVKDIIRDDCVLGPLADNSRTIAEVVPLDTLSH